MAKMLTLVFRVVMPYELLGRHAVSICSTMFLWNRGIYLQDQMTLQPWRRTLKSYFQSLHGFISKIIHKKVCQYVQNSSLMPFILFYYISPQTVLLSYMNDLEFISLLCFSSEFQGISWMTEWLSLLQNVPVTWNYCIINPLNVKLINTFYFVFVLLVIQWWLLFIIR